MKQKTKLPAIAKEHQLLYLYAAFNIILTIVDIFIGWHTVSTLASNSSTVSLHEQRQYEHIGLIIGGFVNAALFGYLIITNNKKHLTLLLKILLGLQLIGFLIDLSANPFDSLISLIEAITTYIVIRDVAGKRPLFFL